MRERGIKSRHGIGLLSENAILPRRILQYAVYEQEKIEVIWLGEWRWVVLDVELIARCFLPEGRSRAAVSRQRESRLISIKFPR